MTYQVLARKWRPRRFAELVGQEHVVRALVNALEFDRLHHAYLFTGTRGVGKTTVARIFAKSLNCETGGSAEPCGTCSACREIDEGRFVDLIEVDAASRTKVDDTRELLDNVQYAPTRGRYKVYLIDEVHMLSGHSFNALLKTLEEPPPHVKFLLATTDPQRVPITVLSRCLQFNLKRLEPAQIEAQLANIVAREGIAAEPAALGLIARAAEGSVRDALSLLDQAIAYGGGGVRETEVREMLGTVDQNAIERLLRALAQGDGAALLAVVVDLAQYHPDYESIVKELLSALHDIALRQAVPGARAEDATRAWLGELAHALAPEDVQLFYQIGVNGRRDLALAPDARAGLEMILLRMLAFRPALAPSVPASPSPTPKAPPPGAAQGEDWVERVERLALQGLARELANHCVVEAESDGEIQLLLDETYANLAVPERVAALEQALSAYHGRALRLRLRAGKPEAESPARRRAREQNERRKEASDAIAADPTVRALQEQFGARVNPESIRPKTSRGER